MALAGQAAPLVRRVREPPSPPPSGPTELDAPPRVTKFPLLHHPPMLAGQEGRVWGQFIVTPEGRVDMASLKVLLSDGAAFEAAAREAWTEERFEPGRLGGQAVPVLAFPVVSFRRH